MLEPSSTGNTVAITSRRYGPGEEPEYFDQPALLRQVLLWCVAAREQLEKWERLVATSVAGQLYDQKGSAPLPDADIWQMEISRSFAVVAARNLLRALELEDCPVSVDSAADVSEEVEELRDLAEHWDENMPVFNVRPREKEPRHKTGKRFAERHPGASPYDFWQWNNRGGAMFTPTLSARDLHAFLDEAERAVLDEAPDLVRFVPERQPSPWVQDHQLGMMPNPDLLR